MLTIALTVLMLTLISCKSNNVVPEKELVYACPALDWPEFPSPAGNIMPIDENLKPVEDEEADVEYVVMPYYYFEKIVDYKVKVDELEIYYKTYRESLKK